MKNILIVLLVLLSGISSAQKEEIYDLTFSDTSNFNIQSIRGLSMYDPSYKTPAHIVVLDTTFRWFPTTFWLNEPDFRSPEAVARMRNDEHHPYNYEFLFRDVILDHLIDDDEKMILSQQAAASTSQPLTLRGAHYETVPYSKRLKGLFFIASEPIFTSDHQYAFINILYAYKGKKNEADNIFATSCIIYKKNEQRIWQKLTSKSFLIF